MRAEVGHFPHPYPLQMPKGPDTPSPSSDGSGMCVAAPPGTPSLLSGRQRPGKGSFTPAMGHSGQARAVLEKSPGLTAAARHLPTLILHHHSTAAAPQPVPPAPAHS